MAAVRPEPEAERVLAALRALYDQIEGGSSHPVQAALEMVGDVTDPDGSQAQPTATSVDAAADHAEAEESEIPDEHSDAEESSAQPEFRRVPVPGHYPPKFRTIRVR
jgi:hypothetical protein